MIASKGILVQAKGMKVQYISSAAVLIEHQRVKVLCDPWLTEGIYYGSWYHYPPLTVGPEDFHDVDYIYITHIHPDHCDAFSLKRFPKHIPILILQYEERFLYHMLRGLGFEQVIEVAHKQVFALGKDFSLEMMAADNCDPTLCGRWLSCHVQENPNKTLQIDSLGVFLGGGKVIVNTNDCPYALSKTICAYILDKHPVIDFLLVGYSGAGPYPQCYLSLSPEEKEKKAQQKKHQFLNYAVSYVTLLKPRVFLPFAGQYTLGGFLSGLNPYRGVPELEDLEDLFLPFLSLEESKSQMLLLNSMESYSLEENKATAPFIPPSKKERAKFVHEVLSHKKFSYETIDVNLKTVEDFFEKLKPAQERLTAKLNHYGFSSETHVYLDIGFESKFLISYNREPCRIVSPQEKIPPYVEFRLHPHLLEMILAKKSHWNNADIGSHLGVDRYPDEHERGIYYFLSYFN